MPRPEPIATLVADPPWRFNDRLPGPGRGAVKHYSVMTVEDICAYPLPALADDARLFLWRVAAMPDEALRVCRAWGFVPKAEVVWVKTTSAGNIAFGMGHQVRNAHEVCLIATRGRPQRLRADVRSVFCAPVNRSKHSEKPSEFFDLVEALSPGPYAELFARTRRVGWYQEGDELA